MSIHYETCTRCDKDLVITMGDDYYFSEIDGKVLCQECWQKEQPKELSKQIADLQSQLAEKDKEIKYYELEWKGCQQKLDHYIGECINLKDEQNQKAIEQLEEVRKTINNKYQYLLELKQRGNLTDYGEGQQTLCCLLLKQIDQQINELKG